MFGSPYRCLSKVWRVRVRVAAKVRDGNMCLRGVERTCFRQGTRNHTVEVEGRV